MPGGDLERERERVAAAARSLAEDGLVTGTAGNLSARSGELVAVTPTGARLEEIAPEQVAVVGLDGEQVAGDLASRLASRRPRSSTGSRRRSPTSTTCCPTRSRCWP